MGVNVETLLIGAIMQQRDLKSARKAGLLPSHFGLHRERVAYQYLLEYEEKTSGDIPPLDIFIRKSGYGEYVEPPPNMSVGGLAKEVIEGSKIRKVEQLIPDPDEIKQDPDTVLRRLAAKSREILVTHGDKTAVPLNVGIIEAMDSMGKSGQKRGLPYPWPAIDQAALGLNPGELIALYGRPGCMKTWVLLSIAVRVIKTRLKSNVLIYTPELSRQRIFQRLLCLLSGIEFAKIRKGQLNEDERQTLEMYREQLESEASGVLGSLYVVEPTDMDVSELVRQVDTLKPDLILVDSAYFLTVEAGVASRESASLAKLCRELTLLGKSAGAPVVITIQAKRAKSEAVGPGGGDDVAYSDVLSQDADVLFRLYPFIDEDTSEERLLMVVKKARDFSLGGIIIEPPPTGGWDELMVLKNAAAAEIATAKIGQQGKKPRQVSKTDTAKYVDQKKKK